jgi:hydrogenase maturation protease
VNAGGENQRDPRALVIGYGSDLRGDDAAGRAVADAIAGMQLSGVAVRSQPQLTPELAMDMAGCDVVVFVDADVDAQEVSVTSVDAASGATFMTHHGDPAALLAMVPSVGELPAAAFVVSIPAHDLGLGTEMSERTRTAVVAAIEVVAGLVA